jgi:hypothetical protein
VVFDETFQRLNGFLVIFFVEEMVVEFLLMCEEGLIHVEILHVLDGEGGGEDSEISLLFEQSESIPFDVGVGN